MSLSDTTRSIHVIAAGYFYQKQPLPPHTKVVSLYTGWVKHDTALSANRLGGEISSESASNDSVGTMGSAYLAPVYSVFVSVFIRSVSFRDEGNSLSEIEINILLGIDSLNFQQTNVVVLVSETALVSEDSGINMKSR